jgi:glycine/D-amino acid oxidase-like deaminating enzyme
MGRPLDPFNGDSELPAHTGVVVIGGGIIGVATALELAERGVPTVLCEKGVIGGEQSSRNWGFCRQMGRDPREVPLAMESLRLWRRMNERVGAETGFRQAGIIYLAETEAWLAGQSRWADEHARPYQLETRVLTPDEAARVMPGATERWKGAIYTASDGRAEPSKAAPALAAAARRAGAKIFTGCAVRGLDLAAGRVAGVVTEKGRIACEQVVLAGGAWSRRFCGNHGIELPQLMVVNSVQRTEPIEAGIEVSGKCERFALRRRLDGGYTVAHGMLSMADIVPDSFRLFFAFLPAIDLRELRFRIGRRFIEEWRLPRRWSLDATSPFEQVRVLDPEPVRSLLDSPLRDLKRMFPAFRDARVAERWAGYIDATPDAVPVISPVDGVPGFYLATGFSGHGFGIGPGAGKLMADIVTGVTTPVVDPAPFRYSRFINGSKIAPMGARYGG